MKISSCSRALAWPTYSASPFGRSARSIASSLGEAGTPLTTRTSNVALPATGGPAANSSVWMLMAHYRTTASPRRQSPVPNRSPLRLPPDALAVRRRAGAEERGADARRRRGRAAGQGGGRDLRRLRRRDDGAWRRRRARAGCPGAGAHRPRIGPCPSSMGMPTLHGHGHDDAHVAQPHVHVDPAIAAAAHAPDDAPAPDASSRRKGRRPLRAHRHWSRSPPSIRLASRRSSATTRRESSCAPIAARSATPRRAGRRCSSTARPPSPDLLVVVALTPAHHRAAAARRHARPPLRSLALAAAQEEDMSMLSRQRGRMTRAAPRYAAATARSGAAFALAASCRPIVPALLARSRQPRRRHVVRCRRQRSRQDARRRHDHGERPADVAADRRSRRPSRA